MPELKHIPDIDYNKLNNLFNNLVALCRNCHTATNTNRKHWKQYFFNLVTVQVYHDTKYYEEKTFVKRY